MWGKRQQLSLGAQNHLEVGGGGGGIIDANGTTCWRRVQGFEPSPPPSLISPSLLPPLPPPNSHDGHHELDAEKWQDVALGDKLLVWVPHTPPLSPSLLLLACVSELCIQKRPQPHLRGPGVLGKMLSFTQAEASMGNRALGTKSFWEDAECSALRGAAAK